MTVDFVDNNAVVRGDTIKLLNTVKRNGSALNITGATFKFVAKRWLNDDTPLIDKDDAAFEILNASAGTVVLTIEPEDTSTFTDNITLHYNIEMTESDGTVTTIARGRIEFKMDVG